MAQSRSYPYAAFPSGGAGKCTYYNSMGLPAKLTSSQLGDLIDGTVNVSAVSDAVNYDEAGRLVDMRMPYGTDPSASSGQALWRRQGYYGWTSSSSPYYGGGNGRLYYIFVGTTQGSLNRLNLNYSYDSFGNVKQHYDNSNYYSFGYDGQNRLTSAYGQSYGYDNAGRLTSYEGAGYSAFDGHAILKSGYSYDANGNLTSRFGRVLVWNHENRLDYVRYGSVIQEQYLYDDQGIRVKKTAGSTSTYYPFAHYEVSGSTTIKYYFFGGMRVAMRRNGTLTYLHSDHLGSTVLETNTSGSASADMKYRAYGNQRDTGPVVTDHKFTGQKYDNTGLYYYNSRYYDPTLGAFISPDSIVPDAMSVLSYNRYLYTRGNPLNRVDPTGHVDSAPYLNPGSNCWQWCGVATMNPRPHPMAGEPDLPTREQVHLALDVAGTVDPTGLADGTNALIYASEGEYANAVLSAVALVPLGDVFKAGKYADEAAEIVGKNVDEAVEKHGPFSRIENAEAASQIEASGSLWGEPMRNNFASDIPRVKAYDRRLRDGELGIEFYTDVAPDTGSPPGRAYWSGPRDGVAVENGKAIICCTVTKNTHR